MQGRVLIFSGFSGFTQRLDNVAALAQQEFDITLDCLVYGRDNYAYMLDNNKANYETVICVEDLFQSCAQAQFPSQDELEELERELGQSLTRIAYSERTFVQHTHSLPMLRPLSQRELICHLFFLSRSLEKMINGTQLVIVYTPASLISEIIYYLCRSKGIKHLTLSEQRIGYRWSLIDNNMDCHREALALYESEDFQVTSAGRERIKDFREMLLGGKIIPVQEIYQKRVRSRKKMTLRNMARYVRNMLLHSPRERFYLAPSKWQHTKYLMRFKIREHYVNTKIRRVIGSERFVYYALPLIPEASTLIRGVKYHDQLALVKRLSLELPIDWVLLVREHPSSVGVTPMAFYKELERIFNVRLLSPHAPALDCIMRADAVITVTGSTGMEALALGRRTIVLGNAIYSEIESVFAIRDISEVGDILRQPWTEEDSGSQIEDMARLASALEAAPGFDDPENMLWSKRAFDPELSIVDREIFSALTPALRKLCGCDVDPREELGLGKVG